MKRERIFTRLHTVKLRLLSNKAMKISEAVLLMILAVSIVLSAFAVTGSATSRTGDPAKLEYAGLVSRKDKLIIPNTMKSISARISVILYSRIIRNV